MGQRIRTRCLTMRKDRFKTMPATVAADDHPLVGIGKVIWQKSKRLYDQEEQLQNHAAAEGFDYP